MKLLAVTLSLLLMSAVSAANYSAFVNDNNLYLTVLGDSCNHISVHLDVANNCKADRKTKNKVIECRINTMMMTTLVGCGDDKVVPQVVTIDLENENIDLSAKRLILNPGKNQVEVELD